MAGWDPSQWAMPGAPVPSAIDAPFPASFEPQPYDPQAGDVPPPWSPEFAAPQDAAQAPVGVPTYMAPEQGAPHPQGVPGLPPPVDESLTGPPGLSPPPTALPNQGAAALGHLRQDPEAEAQSRLFQWHAQEQEAQAKGEGAAAQAYQQRLQDAAAEDQRKNAIATEAGARAEKAITDASNMKVDPGHWWSSRSTGQKIAGFIGAAIGGFLQARQQRGSNPFMDQINQEVNADIQAQVANVNNARAGAGQQMSMYEHMLSQFQSESAARYATAAGMYDAAMKMTAAETAKFRSPITQEEGKLAYTQLLQARDGARAKAMQEEQKGAIEFDKAAREDALALEAIKKSQAERGKIGAEIRAIRDKGDATETVVVHGNEGSVPKQLDAKTAKLVNDAQKFRDDAHKAQSDKSSKTDAEYESKKRLMEEADQRLADTMRAAGYSEADILAVGGGFQKDAIGGNQQVAQKATPAENALIGGQVPTATNRGLLDYAAANPVPVQVMPAGRVPYGMAAPAGLPQYVAPSPEPAVTKPKKKRKK